MSWKTEIQLMDLGEGERLEVTCKTCGHSHYEFPAILIARRGLSYEYLDEVERLLTCGKRGCNGSVRISRSRPDETEGFVGGLA